MTEKQYPELPDPTAWRSYDNLLKRARYDAVPITSTQPGIYSHTRMFTEDQMRAYVDADRAVRHDELEQLCAEAYQVVGVLLDDTGQFNTEHACKILDNLSQMRRVHDDVLPWESVDMDVMRAAQAAPAAVASPLTKLQRKAIAVCFTSDKVSVSEVQRKLSISYADAQTLCQSIVDLGLTDELELAPSLKRGAPAPHPAPVARPSEDAVNRASLNLARKHAVYLSRESVRELLAEAAPAAQEDAEDAARLDYLIESRAIVVSDPDSAPGYWLEFISPGADRWVQIGEYPTPRAAIDAAKGEPSCR